jgi:2,4-dienoyl-CoA reductase-like NADH-dependent reductase (Old Yellow Enzyme family)
LEKAMRTTYPHLFATVDIGPVTVRNRFYMPPHGILSMTIGGPHGSLVPSTDWAQYLAERAAGGVGLLFLPMTANPRIRMPSPLFEEALPNFRAVAQLVHREGAKIFAQLHMREGGQSWEPNGAFMPRLAPSDEPHLLTHMVAHEMTAEEVALWVEAQGRCARNITAAGYDGIELHVTHGMLMEMFLSPYFNKRTDAYGGSLEGRMRVLVESLREVRHQMGESMALGIRLNCDQMLPGGLTQDDATDCRVAC